MEEKKISEKESLELISQMIQQTKERLNIGSGNAFLVWGYTCVILSLTIYALQKSGTWVNGVELLYLLTPIIGGLITVFLDSKNKAGHVVNYSTCIIASCWKMAGVAFGLAGAVCGLFGGYLHVFDASIFFILGFIIPGICTIFTGYALKENSMTYGGYIGIICGLVAIETRFVGNDLSTIWHLVFAGCYLLMMIIPGHYLNHKAELQNKANV